MNASSGSGLWPIRIVCIPGSVMSKGRDARADPRRRSRGVRPQRLPQGAPGHMRSEEHTSELQSLAYLVCRLLLEKKKTPHPMTHSHSETLHLDPSILY